MLEKLINVSLSPGPLGIQLVDKVNEIIDYINSKEPKGINEPVQQTSQSVCTVCKKGICSDPNNVCCACSSTGQEYRQETKL